MTWANLEVLELALRLRATFDTLKRLERYRGHFLNWIDTQTLHPLPPRYASTVDSGNLAACLLILKQGCLDISHRPLWGGVRGQGFLDTLALLDEMVTELDPGKSDAPAAAIQAQLAALTEQVLLGRDEPSQWPRLLTHLLVDAVPRLDQLLPGARRCEGNRRRRQGAGVGAAHRLGRHRLSLGAGAGLLCLRRLRETRRLTLARRA